LAPVFAGVAAGFLLGFVVASSLRPEPAPPARELMAAAIAPSGQAGPPGPPEVALDFGTDDADRALRGSWTRTQLRQHSVAQTAGPEARVEIRLTPQVAQGYALGVLAEAVGIDPEEALEVGVRLNQRPMARWRIGPDWDMQAIVLPPGSVVAGVNVVEFAMPPATGDRRPVLALDSLHLGPLLPRAEASVGVVGVRGSLIRGYHGKEGDGPQAGTWSAGLRTRVGLLLSPASTKYELALDGHAFGPLQPMDVEAVINSKSIGTATLDKGPRSVFPIPPGLLTPGLNIVEFVYPKSVKPADTLKGSQDGRDLAIRISAVSVAPQAAAAPATAAAPKP
jgi:hypothetical protein